MADVEDAPALLAPTPAPAPALPAPNPDAQTTVNDFLDYTEFFPSDLVRSLTLIGDLDATSADAVQQVHDLTALYCRLPQLPDRARPDPVALRRQIARQLQRAISQREYAYTEAARLYEVTVRHCQRSAIIKRKLQAQPEPPSRDPTPPPVSPSALKRAYDRPRLQFGLDRPRTTHPASASAVPMPRGRSRAYSLTSSDDSDDARRTDLAPRARKAHSYRDRPPKPRARAPGVAGTNVHSSIAGISTSNALAKLTPPPADARPGSKWAPWMKLTEYEMAVLRKQMKKNAVWTPSLTMVNRELERKHRTRADYDREKARCEAAGEAILDEEPETLLQIATAQGVDDPALTATADAAHGLVAPGEPAQPRDDSTDGTEGPVDLDSRRQKARGALRALEDATKTIQNAADGLKELTFSAHAVTTPPASAQRKRSMARSATSKRKRDTTPSSPDEDPADTNREPDVIEKDSPTRQPEPKRPRLQLIAPAPPPDRTSSTPAPASAEALASNDPPTPVAPSPAPQSSTPMPEISTSTVQVPLAPAGPGTPKVGKSESTDASQQASPVQSSPAEPKRSSPIMAVSVSVPEQLPVQVASTAPSTRSQRKSITPKNSSPPPVEPSKPTRSRIPGLGRAVSPEPTIALRPRATRSHVPTPKAQSEEPKPNEGRPVRDARRHSIFSQPPLNAPAPTRVSARRKPPPKGEVTSAENGQKTVTNVKRSQGNKKRKKNEGQPEQVEEVDSDEERYCICDDVSYGQMISCDNNCDKEWFHFECVGMTQMPARRAKWYCPDCREKLGTDAFGNPKVPPSLPGRRGKRGWST